MTVTYQLKPYELTDDFLKMLKETFHDKEITVTVEDAQDETEYLLGNEANRKHLLAGVEAAKQGRISHTLTLEQIEEMAK